MNKWFSEKELQIAFKHMKRHLIGNKQTNTTLR